MLTKFLVLCLPATFVLGALDVVPSGPSPGDALQHSPVATVLGRVMDASSGLPVESAQVYIPALNLGGLTDSNGHFLILSVEGETVELVIAHPCFYRVRVELAEGDLSEDEAAAVVVGLPFKPLRIPGGDAPPLGLCAGYGSWTVAGESRIDENAAS